MTTESTRRCQVFDIVRVEVVDQQEKLTARDAVVQSIVEDLCAMPKPSHRSLAKGFRAGLNMPMSEVFRIASIDTQFHADTAMHSIALLPSRGAVSKDGSGLTKGRHVFDPPAGFKVIEL